MPPSISPAYFGLVSFLRGMPHPALSDFPLASSLSSSSFSHLHFQTPNSEHFAPATTQVYLSFPKFVSPLFSRPTNFAPFPSVPQCLINLILDSCCPPLSNLH
ncbi:hypothetical protein CY34DRAFT_803389 [Suillus luteus UH-Slu-Lm8-n1]|uniref:Uncharacterized protein n=1 Tax=Suillus luteus UH-Slu-Lm8-n1 TaxID=930992 RepID=A0A0D0A1F2_9AGAM|nr:hypothetical protein CY34DRAFT_803389 [Suillus luteus UH-Slu-Lm8-n1]